MWEGGKNCYYYVGTKKLHFKLKKKLIEYSICGIVMEEAAAVAHTHKQ